jgi:hypothetical protein
LIAKEQINRSRPFEMRALQARSISKVEHENVILVALQDFEFSYSLGQKQYDAKRLSLKFYTA